MNQEHGEAKAIEPPQRVVRLWRYAQGIACLLALLNSTISCNRRPATPPSEPIHLITPIYIVADLARQIGGDRVDAQWWVEAGQSVDDLQQTPQRRNQLRNADIVISRGVLDPWTLEGANNEFDARRVIRLDQLPSAKDADPRQYLWLDPNVALELIDELTERMSVLDPSSEQSFHKNKHGLREKILSACDRVRPTMDAVRGGFMTLDRGFVPLARRFALNDVPVESINLNDPSAYSVKVLRQTAKNCGAGAIFVNDQTPAALLRDLQPRLGLMVLTLDAVGSSAQGSGRNTYMQVLDYNLQQLEQGMKAGKTPATTATAPSK